MRVVMWRTAYAIALMMLSTQSYAVDIRFSGFGDVVIGASSGGPGDGEAGQLYEEFGSDPFPLSAHEGVTLTGVDFVAIADMTEEFTFLAEVNLQTVRGGSSEIEVDVERVFMNYELDPRFNIQAGLYFTPIGYHNRFLYSRAWLMNSVQVPDLFEEDLNLVPTHSIGVMAHGSFDLKGGSSLKYAVSLANGRASTANSAIYARDENSSKEITGLIEWTIPMFNYSRIGLSGWMDKPKSIRVDNYGDVVAEDAGEQTRFEEFGINPYIVLQGHGFNLLAEYVYSEREDTSGNLGGESWSMSGWTAELSYRAMGGKLHPYIRWDQTDLEDGGDPYLNLREDGGEFTRVFIPEAKQLMLGAAYDINSHARVKGEFIRNFEGAREKNIFTVQLAFGF